MRTAEVTIIIPNYKTPELTCFCLRMLRLNTDPDRVRVIVVDNDSRDESLEYLRRVEWIELVERHDISGETGPEMHARALDLAMERVGTPYVMVMHTDTILCDPGWLDFLLERLNAAPGAAGIGSWKLEIVPLWKRFGKQVESLIRRLAGRRERREVRYLRSHCALYRSDAVRAVGGGFFDGDTAGASLHRRLTESGRRMIFLEAPELMRCIRHLNHATMILNPRSPDRKTARPSARRRIQRELEQLHYREILERGDLDRNGTAK